MLEKQLPQPRCLFSAVRCGSGEAQGKAASSTARAGSIPTVRRHPAPGDTEKASRSAWTQPLFSRDCLQVSLTLRGCSQKRHCLTAKKCPGLRRTTRHGSSQRHPSHSGLQHAMGHPCSSSCAQAFQHAAASMGNAQLLGHPAPPCVWNLFKGNLALDLNSHHPRH